MGIQLINQLIDETPSHLKAEPKDLAQAVGLSSGGLTGFRGSFGMPARTG